MYVCIYTGVRPLPCCRNDHPLLGESVCLSLPRFRVVIMRFHPSKLQRGKTCSALHKEMQIAGALGQLQPLGFTSSSSSLAPPPHASRAGEAEEV